MFSLIVLTILATLELYRTRRTLTALVPLQLYLLELLVATIYRCFLAKSYRKFLAPLDLRRIVN